MLIILAPIFGWSAFYILNAIICANTRERKPDLIFRLGSYTFEEVLSRLALIEEKVGKPLVSVRRAMNRLQRNAHATRRKFRYYGKYIEPVFMDLLIHYESGYWRFFWRNSSLITKLHFFYILSFPLLVYLLILISFMNKLPGELLFALPFIVLAVIVVAGYFLVLNALIYNMMAWFLSLFGIENGVFNRNIAAFESGAGSLKFYRNSAVVIGLGGVLSSSAFGRLVTFKGMSGGQFGGGGASGSW